MMAIKLLRYSVAALLLLLAVGLLLVAVVSQELSVAVRIALAGGALISALFGVGCIVNPRLATRVILGNHLDKY